MRLLFLLSVVALFVTGCASSESQSQTQTTTETTQPVSTIPWNKPERWEGGGALGGAMGGR